MRWYRPSFARSSADPLGLRTGSNLFTYANGSPARFSDPFGLYALKNDITWKDDATNGAWTALPEHLDTSHTCGCDINTKKIKLLFTVKVKTAVHLPPKSEKMYPCYMFAELNHILIWEKYMKKALDKAVLPHEDKTYSSVAECKAAAEAAWNDLHTEVNSFSLMFFHELSQWIEEIRHNTYNPYPLAGTL